MYDAYHVATKTGYNALLIWDKFEDPHKETWTCCPLHETRVTPVRFHTRDVKGVKQFITTHFSTVPNGEKCSSGTGESEAHERLKGLVASIVENEQIHLVSSRGVEIKYDKKDFKVIPSMRFRWEQKVEERRADVLFEFKTWNQLLGNGVVFEVQLSDIADASAQQREADWIKNGYSVAWLYPNDFSDNMYVKDEITIQKIWGIEVSSLCKTMLDTITDKERNISRMVQDLDAMTGKSCRTCDFSAIMKDRLTKLPIQTDLLNCWVAYKKGWGRRPSTVEPSYRCGYWSLKGGIERAEG